MTQLLGSINTLILWRVIRISLNGIWFATEVRYKARKKLMSTMLPIKGVNKELYPLIIMKVPRRVILLYKVKKSSEIHVNQLK